MDIRTIEYAADLLFAMLRNNPELCPHDYEYAWSRRIHDSVEEVHYQCKVCGKQTEQINYISSANHFDAQNK